MLKIIYVIFLGVILALFIGLGIEAFYPSPKSPDYPIALQNIKGEYNDEQRKIEQNFENEMKAAQKEQAKHAKNVSIVAIIASIVFMTLSLTILTKTAIISDGFLLGGLFTLLYSIITGMMSEDNKYRFLLITVGLAVALVLGYLKFIKPKEETAK